MNKRFQKKLTKRIMTEVLDTLTALKSSKQLREEIPLRHAQIHLLDEDGEGVVLSIEYDEETGDIEKSFGETDGDMEVEFDPEEEDIPSEELSEWESEVLKAKGLLN